MIMKPYSENKVSADFSNLTANILFDNVLHEENIAIRNIWQKGDNCYFNVYFYSSGKTKVLDTHYIYDIFDHDSNRYYKDINRFIRDYVQRASQKPKTSPVLKDGGKIEKNYLRLQSLYPEIVILSFFARLSSALSDVKFRVVIDFIRKHLPNGTELPISYIEAFLKSIELSDETFFDSLDKLSDAYPVAQLKDLAADAVKISAADGVIHYEEKLFLAELLQRLRLLEIIPDFEL